MKTDDIFNGRITEHDWENSRLAINLKVGSQEFSLKYKFNGDPTSDRTKNVCNRVCQWQRLPLLYPYNNTLNNQHFKYLCEENWMKSTLCPARRVSFYVADSKAIFHSTPTSKVRQRPLTLGLCISPPSTPLSRYQGR